MTTAPATKPLRRSRPGKFWADENGTTAVELALVAAPFFALLVAIIQTFLVFFAAQLLETATMQSARLILTGQVQSAGLTQSQFAQKVCAQVVALFSCSKLMIDVEAYSTFASATTSSPTLTFNGSGQVSNSWQYNPGSPGQIVVVRIMYQWPVYGGPLGFTLANLSNGNRLLMASAAFQNEP